MTAPTPPSIDIPRWAYSGTFVEPDSTKRSLGWVQVSGQNYGEIPPFQWVNWLSYAAGEWINYLMGPVTSTTGAVRYLQAGGFDTGINLYTQGRLSFFETDNTNHIGLQSPSGLTATSNYILPPSYPVTTGQALSSDSSGNMSWEYNVAGNPAPSKSPNLGGVAPGYIGEWMQTSGAAESGGFSGYSQIGSIPLTSGIWDISASIYMNNAPDYLLVLFISDAAGPTGGTNLPGDNNVEMNFNGTGLTSPPNLALSIPAFRVVLTSSTPYYLLFKTLNHFTSGNPIIVAGRMSAVRVG